MARIERFEELIAWQKARELTREVYATTAKGAFARDYGLVDQMRRAAVSVMSNIAEGSERSSAADFHRFLLVAKGSCAELRSQFYVAFDAGYIAEEPFQELKSRADEVGRIVGGLRLAVARRKVDVP